MSRPRGRALGARGGRAARRRRAGSRAVARIARCCIDTKHKEEPP